MYSRLDYKSGGATSVSRRHVTRAELPHLRKRIARSLPQALHCTALAGVSTARPLRDPAAQHQVMMSSSELLGSPSARERDTCISMEAVEAAALNAGREALAQLEVCARLGLAHSARTTDPFNARPQSVSAEALTESVRQLAAFDERVRAAASAAWTELPSSSLLKSTPTQPPAGTQAAWEEQQSGAASGDSRELSSALALAQQLLARQRAETEHWKSEADRWKAAAVTTSANADESPDSPVAALAAARLELARSRELLTQVSAERDALRIRLMAVQEMGYTAPAHAPGQQPGAGGRQRGHSGLLRAAAEELAAHAAAREAANVAADQASALVAAVSSRHSLPEGEASALGGGDISPTLGGRKHSAGSSAESAARLRERMLRQTGEDDS